MSDNQKVDIIKQIASELGGFPVHVIESRWRKREVVQLRQLCMDLIRRNTKLSLKSTGEQFGGFDHSSVIHATQTVSDLYDTDKNFENTYNCILQRIKLRFKTTNDIQKSIAVRKKRLLL